MEGAAGGRGRRRSLQSYDIEGYQTVFILSEQSILCADLTAVGLS